MKYNKVFFTRLTISLLVVTVVMLILILSIVDPKGYAYEPMITSWPIFPQLLLVYSWLTFIYLGGISLVLLALLVSFGGFVTWYQWLFKEPFEEIEDEVVEGEFIDVKSK